MDHIVYFVQRADGDIKIGTTARYAMRMRQLMFEHGVLKVLGVIPGNRATEKHMHERFALQRRQRIGETTGRVFLLEWFAPTPELLWFATFETQRPEQSVFTTISKERVVVAPPRPFAGVGYGYLPVENNVQRMLIARFGSLDKIPRMKLSKDTAIAPQAIRMWLDGYIQRAEMSTVRKWATYLDCAPEDLLAYEVTE